MKMVLVKIYPTKDELVLDVLLGGKIFKVSHAADVTARVSICWVGTQPDAEQGFLRTYVPGPTPTHYMQFDQDKDRSYLFIRKPDDDKPRE